MPPLWDEATPAKYYALDDTGAPMLMSLPELAFHVGRTLDWLYRPKNVEKMEREHGMPKPHPAFADRKPIMYVRAEIRAWLQPGRAAADKDTPPAAQGPDPELAARAAAIAGRM